MPNDPILHLLGLAKKAGRLEIGEEPVGAACRARQARLILLAADAAPNTCRRAAHFGEAGNILWLETPLARGSWALFWAGPPAPWPPSPTPAFPPPLWRSWPPGTRTNTAPQPFSCGPRPTGCSSGRESSGSTRKTCGTGRKSPGLRRPGRRRRGRPAEAGPIRPRRPGHPGPTAVFRTAPGQSAPHPPRAAPAAAVLPASSVNPEKRGACIYDD